MKNMKFICFFNILLGGFNLGLAALASSSLTLWLNLSVGLFATGAGLLLLFKDL